MENFLLILDEIDDALAAARALWPQIMGFLIASGLFCLSIVAIMQWPVIALGALFCVALFGALPSIRTVFWVRLRADR